MPAGTALAAVVAALIGTAPQSSPAQTFAAQRFTLGNGMRVIVQPDARIPNVALHLVFLVGSRNERPGLTGAAHFVEHMMFRGTESHEPGEFDRVLETAGGMSTAQTSADVTAYTDLFPRQELPLIFNLEAERLRRLPLKSDAVDAERAVVQNERRTSVDADPYGALREQLWAAAYVAHPYQWPIVGFPGDIEGWSEDELGQLFNAGYAPNNAVLVVCGDVDAPMVNDLARRAFEGIPARAAPGTVRSREPEQHGERRARMTWPGQTQIVMMGFHVPAATHPDYYALELLRTLLFSGESSRMRQILVDRYEIALSVTGTMDPALDPTLFTITAVPKPGIGSDAVEQAIVRELDRLGREFVSAAELQKAKNLFLAHFYRSMRDLDGRAHLLGTYEAVFGDYNAVFGAADTVQEITKEDLRRVVRRYFVADNRTVATLAQAPEEHAP